MNRRTFSKALGTQALAAVAFLSTRPAPLHAQPAGGPLRVAMLVHPDMVLLDLVGPQTVFSLLMAEVHLVGKDRRPVPTDVGIPITPTTTYADCPADLDVLFVPGGLKGSVALMDRAPVLTAAREAAGRARGRLGL